MDRRAADPAEIKADLTLRRIDGAPCRRDPQRRLVDPSGRRRRQVRQDPDLLRPKADWLGRWAVSITSISLRLRVMRRSFTFLSLPSAGNVALAAFLAFNAGYSEGLSIACDGNSSPEGSSAPRS
jgi:hypothetical protein